MQCYTNIVGNSLFVNKKECYVNTPAGDLLLVEVEEHHGAIVFAIGDKIFHLDPDAAFDIADVLTMVANGMESHLGDEYV
jgi:hypothetical protein